MPSLVHTPVNLVDNDGNTKSGRLQTTHYDKNERIKRALQRLGLFWMLAIVTLFIPLAHFVLVPAFLITGPISAYLTLKAEQIQNHTTGTCPVCSKEIQLAMNAKETLPKWTYCTECSAPLQIIDIA